MLRYLCVLEGVPAGVQGHGKWTLLGERVTDRALPAGSLRSEQGPAPRGLCTVGFRERKGSWGLLQTARPLVEVRLLMVLLFTGEATVKKRQARCWTGCCSPAGAGGGEGAVC